MEKVASGSRRCHSRPGGPEPASPPVGWKKAAPDSLKKDSKFAFCKASAASQRVEGEGARTNSPSRVSKLLEAWEKGLVGLDTPSADTRPSRSPIPTRRLRSTQGSAHSCFPANSRNNSLSPSNLASVDARRCLSPANTRQSFSPTGRSHSPFSVDAQRPCSPDLRHSFGPAESRRPHFSGERGRSPSPARTRRPFSPAQSRRTLSPARPPRFPVETQGAPSSTGDNRSRSPVGRRYSPSRTDNRHISSLEDTQSSSSLSENRCLHSVADMRRFYSGAAGTRQPSPPASFMVETRRPEDRSNASPSSDVRSSSSLTNTGCSSPSSEAGGLTSPSDNRCSSPLADDGCSAPLPDAIAFSSQANERRSSSPVDTRCSRSLEESGRCSHSLGPQRDFTAHQPVFAQVYSPALKSKGLGKMEVPNAKSTRVIESPEVTLCGAAPQVCPATEFPEGGQVSNNSQEKNLALPSGATVSQKESQMPNGACSRASPEALRESNLSALRPSTEMSASNSVPGSPGGSYMPSATNLKPSEQLCMVNPVPHTVCSSTVAKSQNPWYEPRGRCTVAFRDKPQVIAMHPGCFPVHQAGQEIVNSTSGNTNKPQQEASLASSSIECAPVKGNRQFWADLSDVESLLRMNPSFPKSGICSSPGSESEIGVTQSRNASVCDAQRPRCMLGQSPSLTSNREAILVREGVTPFSTSQRDCSLPSQPASQKHGNRFAGSMSKQEQSTPDPGGPASNGPDQESSMISVGKAGISANQRIRSSLGAAGKTGISATSQPTSPKDHKVRTQVEPTKEQRLSGKGAPKFALEQKLPSAETLTSLPEPSSQKTSSSNPSAEQEPEEVGDMEHFVVTLRNMDPTELWKPSKGLPRSLRPSALAKHTVLPPIDEDHIVPKSKAPLPAPIGELFVLTEEIPEEGKEPKREEPGLAEDDTEPIENPYLTTEEKPWDSSQGRRAFPWEEQQCKAEEETGSFSGKLPQSPEEFEANAVAPQAIANQTNLIKTNFLKGISLLSNFADRKAVEDKPYSRLDNSFLYSKFILPEKSALRAPAKEKAMKGSTVLLSPMAQKFSRECQIIPNGPPGEAVCKEPNSKLLPTGIHASGGSKEAENLTQAEIQEEERKPTKINKRPGKIILYPEPGFGGQKREIWSDVPDATSWELSSTISIQVIRGGWLMYEKPRFHGRKCVLAEGNVEIANPWRMYCKEGSERENAPFRIGSLKRVVQDYRLPEISFFTEEHGEGSKQRFTDSAEDTRMYGRPLKAASIIVHSGLWLVYSKPFFDDDPYVLEPGGYPNLQAWGAKDPSVCSMHPIKLGSPVVEKSGEPKVLIFERPHFQGHCCEVSRDIYNLKKSENNQDSTMSTVGSLKIMGGCWVGYEKEGFRGHQYLLEEGEYSDWTEWGGYDEELASLRLIRTDFLDPGLVLFEAMDFEEGPSVELSEALPDVELASYGTTTQSIHVLSGVWVAYEDKNFGGEQYILEKGVYRSCEDWGASSCRIASVQPIQQVGEQSLHFISKIQLFSDPDFSGSSMTFKEDQASLPENFLPHSCRVNGGSWILYDGPQFDGEQHILSEGEYPTLTSMGCVFTTAIVSLKKVPVFFSEPSIFLHGLECFEGKEIELNGEMRSLQAEGFNNHVLSVRVKGGIWVLCEHSDFRGRQWLLDSVEITNWLTYSGLQQIGSLYPIKQRRIYFRVKNVELNFFLSVPDDAEDMKAGRVLVSELSDKSSSIWYYDEGLMKNQVAPSMSLQVIGPAGKGAKVVLWSESRMPQQTWRVDSFGKIWSQMFEDKVLDVKGGRTYDRDHAILWAASEERPTQIWDVQVL